MFYKWVQSRFYKWVQSRFYKWLQSMFYKWIQSMFYKWSSPGFTDESSPGFTNESSPCFTNGSSPGFTSLVQSSFYNMPGCPTIPRTHRKSFFFLIPLYGKVHHIWKLPHSSMCCKGYVRSSNKSKTENRSVAEQIFYYCN